MNSIRTIITFMIIMWIMVIFAGGFAVVTIEPISISGYGDLDNILTPIGKFLVATGLIIVWVIILSKLKNRLLRKQIF